MRKYIYLILCVLCTQQMSGQVYRVQPASAEASNKGKAILAHLMFGFHMPGGDLRLRFGPAFSAGLGTELITQNNFILGVEGHFFYGNEVKEDPLAILRTPEGDIIGSDRLLASVVLRQRGLYVGGNIGKLVTFSDRRSGLRLTLGAGIARHRIRVQDDNESVTQLRGDYKKGYDRLTGGLGVQQFIGWQHLSENRRSNWMLGFEFSQAFNNTLRDWDFNEMRKLDEQRVDLRFGIRAVWTLPFYVGNSKEIFY